MYKQIRHNIIDHLILQMWPGLIAKAKEGGLDVVETYVFWNVHEPSRGEVTHALSTHAALMCANV